MDFLSVEYDDIECDSEALFKAISEGKTEELLKNHPGAATLVWTDIETELVYIWVSGAKSTYSNYIKPDREFHIWKTVAGIYFSSESEPLEMASLMAPDGFEIDTPQSVPCNTLLTFDGDKLVDSKEITRTPYYISVNSGNVNKKSGKTNNIKPLPSTKKSGTNGQNEVNNSPEKSKENSGNEQKSDSPKTSVPLYKGGADFRNYSRKELPGLEEEPKVTPYFQLCVKNGLYFRGDLAMHSVVNYVSPIATKHIPEYRKLGYWIDTRFYVDKEGLLYWYNGNSGRYIPANVNSLKYDEKGAEDHLTEVFFYQGVLMKDEESLINLLEIRNDAIKASGGKNLRLKAAVVARFARVPVWKALSFPDLEVTEYYNFGLANMKVAAEKGYNMMRGYFKYPFTDTAYKFDAGVPTQYIFYPKEMYCTDEDSPLEEGFISFRDSWQGDKCTWAYKSNGTKNNIYSTSCPSCGSIHKLSRKDILKVPTCFECGSPIVVQDEKYFPKMANSQKA
jgi:hypothetical protein